ncbi:penicillin acylase family protein [Streptomyces sp. 5-10]|uniref:penicillin acylase family protein n=1 Tax=Streptomyces sp. 5-10 TaxID=878925 RepID=UPI00168AD3F7|nr:penicillin acylase family protein [Streptomyces sp. 5-10]MBD3003832.1 penicillin acylase family protein [Streptomyces sp. 5-10]
MSGETYRDPWGIPHLRAGSVLELAFMQGRNAAIDRAWQIEVERHRFEGTSAAVFGAEAMSWDKFARQVRLAGTARGCFSALRQETKTWFAAYVDGVNSGLQAGARNAPQFAVVGLRPGEWQPWTPLGIWLSTHILLAGFPNKLWRGEVARALGSEAIGSFAMGGRGVAGSNGWLLVGDRTLLGKPILAGDPHRVIEDPGVYQQIRLSCAEFDVVGFAVPGVPGVPHFGHTGRVAWSITHAMADCQDVYRERLRRRGSAVEALGPDGWEPADVHVETVTVAGGEPVEVEVVETARGPLVVGGPDDTEALSLRYPPRVCGDLGFDALLPLMRASCVAEVDAALDKWVDPVNVVLAADSAGDVLYRVAGRVPVRARKNQLHPVPAWEEGHAWQGWYQPMPRETVESVAVMANHAGLAMPLGVDFAPAYRADRIRHLLGERKWSAADMASIHMDTYAGAAAPLLRLLRDVTGLSAEAVDLRDRLLNWDRRMQADSTDATEYARVRAAVVRRLAEHPALAPLAEPAPYPDIFLPWLFLTPRVAAGLDNLLADEAPLGMDRTELLRAALEDVAAGPGTVPWGTLHKLSPWTALPQARDALPWPDLSGDSECVLSTTRIQDIDGHLTRGPAARYVWDLADRQNSLWIVPLGASGVPGPHHHDQLPLWERGELVPVITDWGRLRKET